MMSRLDFIFSNKQSHRVSRHLAFLSTMGLVFFLQSIVPGVDIYETAFFSLSCFFPVCILSVYICLYFLLPFFLQQKRYERFLVAFIFMAAVFLVINYSMAGIFLIMAPGFPHSSETQMGLSFINTSHALIIGGLALGIKFAKNLYLQHTENSGLARKKIITELQLEKARIYPRFLYQSLDNLRAGINSGAPDASALLLKISDLLSYILYDNNEKWVLLENELDMMQNLIDVEKTSRAKHSNIRVQISGSPDDKYIVPMTLFPLVENCFKALVDKNVNKPQISLDIKIEANDLYLSLVMNESKTGNTNISDWHHVFRNTSQRLDALYPEGCRLKMKEEKHSFTVLLHVILKSNNMHPSNHSIAKEIKQGIYENS